MKKIFYCLSALAVVALASCDNKKAAEDSATIQDTAVVTGFEVESENGDEIVVGEEVTEVATKAGDAAAAAQQTVAEQTKAAQQEVEKNKSKLENASEKVKEGAEKVANDVKASKENLDQAADAVKSAKDAFKKK